MLSCNICIAQQTVLCDAVFHTRRSLVAAHTDCKPAQLNDAFVHRRQKNLTTGLQSSRLMRDLLWIPVQFEHSYIYCHQGLWKPNI